MEGELTMRGRPHSGNGDLSYEEAKSHFTAWALMKSPLLISCDVRAQNLALLRKKCLSFRLYCCIHTANDHLRRVSGNLVEQGDHCDQPGPGRGQEHRAVQVGC